MSHSHHADAAAGNSFPISPLRLAVLISGGGTTLKNLLERIADGSLDARVLKVISSNPQAGGLRRARQAGIPAEVVQRQGQSLARFSEQIFDHCREVNPHLVVMGGFLKLVRIPPDFQNRVLNIHPALIPAFCGKGLYGEHVHRAVLEYGAKISGCTVHFVDQEYDHGPIVLQKGVPVLEGDTPRSLADRVFEAECKAYPEALRLYAAGRLRVEGRVVRVLPEKNA